MGDHAVQECPWIAPSGVRQPPGEKDFTLSVPAIKYICPKGHEIRLRYDLFPIPDEDQLIYCIRCPREDGELAAYPVEDCVKHYPRSEGGRRLLPARMTHNYDAALLRNRMASYLNRVTQLDAETRAWVAEQCNTTENHVQTVFSEMTGGWTPTAALTQSLVLRCGHRAEVELGTNPELCPKCVEARREAENGLRWIYDVDSGAPLYHDVPAYQEPATMRKHDFHEDFPQVDPYSVTCPDCGAEHNSHCFWLGPGSIRTKKAHVARKVAARQARRQKGNSRA